MNPVAVVLRAVQLARAAGLVVTFEPGWETRGNGYAPKWVGGIMHHTATPSSLENPFPSRRVLRDGRSNLAGPLCNSAGPADGSIHIMAAQAANHAGASGGRSMGPLPTTTLFNPWVWGHETDYAGTVPMLPGQYVAAVIWFRCLLIALTEAGQIPVADVERIRLHAETSITGKWDAGDGPTHTIDAGKFRRDIVTATIGDIVTLTPEEHGWLAGLNTAAGETWRAEQKLLGTVVLQARDLARSASSATGQLLDAVAALRADVAELKDALPAIVDVDEAAIAADVVAKLAERGYDGVTEDEMRAILSSTRLVPGDGT